MDNLTIRVEVPRDEHGRPLVLIVAVSSLIMERAGECENGYQREAPGAAWVEARSGDNFNPSRVRPLEIADLSHEGRPGVYAVIDGQGRLALLLAQGIPNTVARIHYDTTIQKRASLFRGLDDMRKLKYGTIFQAKVVEGDDDAVAIHGVLKAAGFDTKTNDISGLATVKHVYDHLGLPALRKAAAIYSKSWKESGYLDSCKLSGQAIAGLAIIIASMGKELNEGAVVRVLNDLGPKTMSARILEDNGGIKIRTDHVPQSFARNLSQAYNRATQRQRDTIVKIDLGKLRDFSDGKNF